MRSKLFSFLKYLKIFKVQEKSLHAESETALLFPKAHQDQSCTNGTCSEGSHTNLNFFLAPPCHLSSPTQLYTFMYENCAFCNQHWKPDLHLGSAVLCFTEHK